MCDQEIKKRLGRKIKIFRAQKNLSQEKLSQILGVCRYQISLWEKGKQFVSTKHLLKICETFNENLGFFDIYANQTKDPKNVQLNDLHLQQ
jgi:transcriptional regulator with XRE-family HTH domain